VGGETRQQGARDSASDGWNFSAWQFVGTWNFDSGIGP